MGSRRHKQSQQAPEPEKKPILSLYEKVCLTISGALLAGLAGWYFISELTKKDAVPIPAHLPESPYKTAAEPSRSLSPKEGRALEIEQENIILKNVQNHSEEYRKEVSQKELSDYVRTIEVHGKGESDIYFVIYNSSIPKNEHNMEIIDEAFKSAVWLYEKKGVSRILVDYMNDEDSKKYMESKQLPFDEKSLNYYQFNISRMLFAADWRLCGAELKSQSDALSSLLDKLAKEAEDKNKEWSKKYENQVLTVGQKNDIQDKFRKEMRNLSAKYAPAIKDMTGEIHKYQAQQIISANSNTNGKIVVIIEHSYAKEVVDKVLQQNPYLYITVLMSKDMPEGSEQLYAAPMTEDSIADNLITANLKN